jgi:hypothetical protein
MKNKALIWTLAIAGVALATYVTISLLKKPADTNKPLLSPGTLANIGSAISSIFTPKTAADTSSSEIGGGMEFNVINTLDSGNVDPAVDLGYTVSEVPEG